MAELARDRLLYQAVFFATYGLGPWKCYFCTLDIFFDETSYSRRLHIHHLDHDHENRLPNNLVPTHGGCHLSYHHKGSKKPYASAIGKKHVKLALAAAHTPEVNEKRRQSILRWREEHPDEFLENQRKQAEANRRRKHTRTPEQCARIREGQRRVWKTCACGRGPMPPGAYSIHHRTCKEAA